MIFITSFFFSFLFFPHSRIIINQTEENDLEVKPPEVAGGKQFTLVDGRSMLTSEELTCDDVAIAIFGSVLLFLGHVPGSRLTLKETLAKKEKALPSARYVS